MDSPSITETQGNIITHTIDEETKARKDKGYAPGVGAGWGLSEERPGNTERSNGPGWPLADGSHVRPASGPQPRALVGSRWPSR